jgi:probable rRNA maturation factor
MKIIADIEDERWTELADIFPQLEHAAKLIGDGADYDVQVLLTSDDNMQVINRDWRAIDKPTNVLSFPSALSHTLPQGVARPLGDIVLAYDTLLREAHENRKPVRDHVTHLFVHGLLHLLGYNHETEAEADVMETKERDVLAQLGLPDPYAHEH